MSEYRECQNVEMSEYRECHETLKAQKNFRVEIWISRRYHIKIKSKPGRELFLHNFRSADPTATLVWDTVWTVPLKNAIKCREGDVLGEFGRNHTTLRHCVIPEA